MVTFRFSREERTSQVLTPVATRPKKTSLLLASTNDLTAASVILFRPDKSRETRAGRTWGLPSRSCRTISSPSLPSLSSAVKWSSEKSRCLRMWSWLRTKSNLAGDISSCRRRWAIKDLRVFLHSRSAMSFETAVQEMSRLSSWGREQMSSRTSSVMSVWARLSVLRPFRELKPTRTPPLSPRDSQSRWSPFRDNLWRLDLHSGLKARPEMMLAPVRPPETQEASSSWRRWGQRARRKASADTGQQRMEARRRRSSLQFRKIPTVVSFSIPCRKKEKTASVKPHLYLWNRFFLPFQSYINSWYSVN